MSDYESAASTQEMDAIHRAAAQGDFLREHADLIVPELFPLHERTRRSFTRLLRGWGECGVRIDNQRRGIPAPEKRW